MGREVTSRPDFPLLGSRRSSDRLDIRIPGQVLNGSQGNRQNDNQRHDLHGDQFLWAYR